jgi:hypothetical protein
MPTSKIKLIGVAFLAAMMALAFKAASPQEKLKTAMAKLLQGVERHMEIQYSYFDEDSTMAIEQMTGYLSAYSNGNRVCYQLDDQLSIYESDKVLQLDESDKLLIYHSKVTAWDLESLFGLGAFSGLPANTQTLEDGSILMDFDTRSIGNGSERTKVYLSSELDIQKIQLFFKNAQGPKFLEIRFKPLRSVPANLKGKERIVRFLTIGSKEIKPTKEFASYELLVY